MAANEKTIRVMKVNCSDAYGWAIHNGVIQVEVAKADWERLEEAAKRVRMDLDFVIAEALLDLFRESGEVKTSKGNV